MESLEEQLKKRLAGKVLILCLGNDLRSDDGAGTALARMLHGLLPVVIIDAGSAPENFLYPILRENPDTVAFIDAADFQGEPGEMRILDSTDLTGRSLGTHGASPGIFMELLKEGGVGDVFMVGIQPLRTRLGQDISSEVESAMDALAGILRSILWKTDDEHS